MKIDFFDVEAWMTEHEKDYRYNLAETCVDSMNINDLLKMVEDKDAVINDILNTKLDYGPIEGSKRLRKAIAKLYKTGDLDNIAIIHQNPYVFHTSVRHNLTLYQDYSDSLLISTLKKVGLWEACCHQLDYELTGDNFSGGQIIKLEIARAILRGKQVLLADEMMASLDVASSKEISNVLKQLPNSIIEIAHHYNLEDYDAVYRIENKSIVRIK